MTRSGIEGVPLERRVRRLVVRRKDKAMDIQLGLELFMFDGFNHWCDTAQDKFKAANVTSSNTLCIDAKGRICAWGTHFMQAAKDNAYPVRVYLLREDMLETPNAALTGAEGVRVEGTVRGENPGKD